MCNYRDKIVLHSNNLSNLTNDKVDQKDILKVSVFVGGRQGDEK